MLVASALNVCCVIVGICGANDVDMSFGVKGVGETKLFAELVVGEDDDDDVVVVVTVVVVVDVVAAVVVNSDETALWHDLQHCPETVTGFLPSGQESITGHSFVIRRQVTLVS